MRPVIFLLLAGFSLYAASIPRWQDPGFFEENQTEPHAFHVPFTEIEHALADNRAACDFHRLLNGQWTFKWVEKPVDVPEGFFTDNFDTSGWEKIRVPSNWQMRGYGHAKFRNIALCFRAEPPKVPSDYNPVGLYRRYFQVPELWQDRDILLRFEGVKAAARVWINGKYVGYNEGSFEPAEFDITPFVTPGANLVAVEVLRFCDGTFLENQDMWRLSGIFRDVKLTAVPKVRIHDIYTVTDLDEQYRDAHLHVSIDLKNTLSDRVTGYQLRADVLRGTDPVLNNTMIVYPDIEGKSTQTIALKTHVENPKKWSAEAPNLYTLLCQLLNKNGEIVEVFAQNLGFREVEICGDALCINGVPVKFNAVNSHMHHPDHGQAVPLETLRRDLLLMKQHNINCVRTSHYPSSPEYLDLADEIGMYVFDEVNDEAHSNTQLSDDSLWTDLYKDRARKLVYRDRNHASVVVWSAGNESGSGANIKAVIETGKRIDPSRPAWMYGGNKFYIPFEDIIGPRYWTPERLQRLAEGLETPQNDNRPSFMDEYLAATGNGIGGLDEYWQLVRSHSRLTGGAIWDWVSPGVTAPVWITPDASANQFNAFIMGRPAFVNRDAGRALKFSGHDDWVECYRHPELDITGEQLTIEFRVRPGHMQQPNTFLCKSRYQYGILQPHPDSLSFYIHTENRIRVSAPVPENWYGNWHHVAGIYNGQTVVLYIDYQKAAELPANGRIRHAAYPLCLGRDAELHDQGEFSGRLSCMTLDDVRLYDKALSIKQLKVGDSELTELSVLSLDFESDRKDATFYWTGLGGRTYGIIWPDRTPQPEIMQIKYSAQPVQIEAADLRKGLVRVTNRHHFKNLQQLDCLWQLLKDGRVVQSGQLDLDLAPGTSADVRVPYKPAEKTSAEQILTLSFRLRRETAWASAGHEVAWEQLLISAPKDTVKNNPISLVRQLHESDEIVRLVGDRFDYEMNKETGQFTRMRYDHIDLLQSGPEYSVWRAPTANDQDPWGSYMYSAEHRKSGLGRSIENELRALGLDSPTREMREFQVSYEDSGVYMHLVTHIMGLDSSGFILEKNIRVNREGKIDLNISVTPQGPMPDHLPRSGLVFTLPDSLYRIEWYGRGPFETYPDRKTGAKIGVYESTAENDIVPYLIPQDYGNHTDVRWFRVMDDKGHGLLFCSKKLLNFSLHPFSTDHLTRANYRFQLERAPYNTLNVDFAVTGVGGTAIRTLPKYRVQPQQRTYDLQMIPF